MTNSSVLVVDISQVIIAACVIESKELTDKSNTKNTIKHIALSTLLSLKRKFNPFKIYIACDSKNYWRTTEFSYYKGHRKHAKEVGFLDWSAIAESIDEVKFDLKENFPFTVIEVEGAEADDVIAFVCKHYQENNLVNKGLIEEPRDIIIVSTDKDFQQLQKYENVKQWNNIQKKMITCSNPKHFLVEHIAHGDTGDNIPSIVNDNNWAKCRAENISTRAKPFKSTRLKDFHEKGIDACLNDEERKNWKRNETLVNLDMVPEHINNKIHDEMISYEIKSSKVKIMNYFIKNRMKLLLGSASEF